MNLEEMKFNCPYVGDNQEMEVVGTVYYQEFLDGMGEAVAGNRCNYQSECNVIFDERVKKLCPIRKWCEAHNVRGRGILF